VLGNTAILISAPPRKERKKPLYALFITHNKRESGGSVTIPVSITQTLGFGQLIVLEGMSVGDRSRYAPLSRSINAGQNYPVSV
jgi:hypothetical protein